MSSEDAGRDGQSILTLEWTNQHGCGGNEETDPQKQNCNIVLQYMCQKNSEDAAGNHVHYIQWNLSVTTTSIIKSVTCDLFSNVF